MRDCVRGSGPRLPRVCESRRALLSPRGSRPTDWRCFESTLRVGVGTDVHISRTHPRDGCFRSPRFGRTVTPMPPALRVEGVSKQYRIYTRPADRLKESLTRGRRRYHREFWALSNISFEVEGGTTTGIIGPNGSGKSTLLQIITGTLDPTHGTVWHAGRIAALLELGAGFNPEFTGIENVFLNASLMGLSRKQTVALLPEIERFAEIGPFIHQPVKTYSSGMYVRLA